MTEQMQKALHEASLDFGKATVSDDGQVTAGVISEKIEEGVSWYRNSLWHETGETPLPGRELIVSTYKGIKIYPNPSNGKMAWPFFVRISRAARWAYSEDILPDPESAEPQV